MVDGVAGLGAGHVVGLGADAADARRDPRHLLHRPAHAERLEAAQLRDPQVGVARRPRSSRKMSIRPWPSRRVIGSMVIGLHRRHPPQQGVAEAEAVEGPDRVRDPIQDLLDLLLVGGVDDRGQRRDHLGPLVTHLGRRPVAAAARHARLRAQRAAARARGGPQAHEPLVQEAAARVGDDLVGTQEAGGSASLRACADTRRSRSPVPAPITLPFGGSGPPERTASTTSQIRWPAAGSRARSSPRPRPGRGSSPFPELGQRDLDPFGELATVCGSTPSGFTVEGESW